MRVVGLIIVILSVVSLPVQAQECPAPQPLSNMTLTFDDAFQGNAIDTSKWTTVAMGGADAINEEQEAYIPSALQLIPGGGLRIQANNKAFLTSNFTSGEISSRGHFSQLYGHYEMMARMPDGDGLWPAFWLLPDNGSWPPEIDILEYVYAVNGVMPTSTNKVSGAFQTLHWQTSEKKNNALGIETHQDFGGSYHIYAVDWRPGSLVFLIDGVVQNCITDTSETGQRVSATPMYMIANLAIGHQNGWSGSVTNTTPFPANMDISYIKAYQYNDLPIPAPEPLRIANIQVSPSTAKPGDRVVISADVVVGNNDLPGPTQTQFFIYNYDGSKTIAELSEVGPSVYKAHQTYHYSVPFVVPSSSTSEIYSIALGVFYNNYAEHQWFSQTGFPPISVSNAASCGTTPSGQTVWSSQTPASATTAATNQQCPYGGTVLTTWSNQSQLLCTNGVLAPTGQTQKVNVITDQPICALPAPCGTHASGSTYALIVGMVSGSQAATPAQCLFGGTLPIATATTQNYLCTNGVQTAQGQPTLTTTVAGSPKCTVPPAIASGTNVDLVGFMTDKTTVKAGDVIAVNTVYNVRVNMPAGGVVFAALAAPNSSWQSYKRSALPALNAGISSYSFLIAVPKGQAPGNYTIDVGFDKGQLGRVLLDKHIDITVQ